MKLTPTVSANSKRFQRSHAAAIPTLSAKAATAPAASAEVDKPTYLEVPDFQRVAIIGDYASGVLLLLSHL